MTRKLKNIKLVYGDRKPSNCDLRQGRKVVWTGREYDRAFWGGKNVLYAEQLLDLALHL